MVQDEEWKKVQDEHAWGEDFRGSAETRKHLDADAFHLALSGKAERFATFDEVLVKQARKLGVRPPLSAP